MKKKNVWSKIRRKIIVFNVRTSSRAWSISGNDGVAAKIADDERKKRTRTEPPSRNRLNETRVFSRTPDGTLINGTFQAVRDVRFLRWPIDGRRGRERNADGTRAQREFSCAGVLRFRAIYRDRRRVLRSVTKIKINTKKKKNTRTICDLFSLFLFFRIC